MKKQNYVDSRLIPQEQWFSRKAVINKRIFYLLSTVSCLASLSVAPLVQVDNCPRVLITCVTLLSSLALFANHLLKSEKSWLLYRTISELLKKEKAFYEYSVDPYSKPDSRDVELARRAELIISKALDDWRQMQLAEDNEDHGGKKTRKNKDR